MCWEGEVLSERPPPGVPRGASVGPKGGQMCSVLSPAALWSAIRGGVTLGSDAAAPSSTLTVAEQSERRARRWPVLLSLLLALGAAALTPAPALADTKTWMGQFLGDRFWTTPGNWMGGVAPVAGDDLVFPANAVHFVTTNDFADGTIFN